ncbi:flagellar hook-associated protein 2 [Ureibacillus thermosphaericus]|uniref:flagellar hook-associated protein 2 n=1 Tax=Ureibacillus thermosphaericus TaxID=51173 RepID=UPI0030C8E841
MSQLRIGGLASGMDIDELVEKLMQAERAPLNKLEQQKQIYEWTRDAYRDVNKKLQTFDTYIADNLLLKSFNTKTATSTNTNLIDVTATSSASGTLTIEGVSQLASAARAVGGQVNGIGTTTLGDLFANSGVTVSQNFIEIRAIQKDGTLAAEATRIEFTENMTIDQFVSKINSSAAGVSAVFENGRLSITAKNTGDVKGGAEIVVDSGQAVFKAFKFTGFESADDSEPIELADNGKNAIFQVNGIDTERATNTFSISGYTITLKNTFNSLEGDSTTNPVMITSTTNVDDIISKIKDFVNTYNGLIKELNDVIKESKYRDYPPLTEAQKKEMDEKEIELWEEKAKSGLLRSDSIIRDGLSKMRALIYEAYPGVSNTKYNTLYSIGITTTKSYNDGGLLEIDENKLRAALEEDPDAVTKLFTNSSGKKEDKILVNGEEKTADTRGFLQKLRDEMNNIKLQIEKKAGRTTMTANQYTLGKTLTDIESRINSWKDKLITIEERYWRQFTAMEQAINKANMQASLFMPQY